MFQTLRTADSRPALTSSVHGSQDTVRLDEVDRSTQSMTHSDTAPSSVTAISRRLISPPYIRTYTPHTSVQTDQIGVSTFGEIHV